MPCWLISLGGLIFSEGKRKRSKSGGEEECEEGLGGEKSGKLQLGCDIGKRKNK